LKFIFLLNNNKKMHNKYDITSRERKNINRIHKRDSSYITSKNLDETKSIIKWHKNNNSKKGGKSRHIIN